MIYEEINKHTGIRQYYSAGELAERLRLLGFSADETLRAIDADTPLETRHQVIRKDTHANG